MEHIIYWFWLTEAVSFSKIKQLHKKYGNVEGVYAEKDYSAFPFLTPEDIVKLSDKRTAAAKAMFDRCVALGIRVIVWDSRLYPPMLRHISSPPLILYARGIIPDWKSIFTIGIVGTRSMTNYGREVTERFATGLIDAGATIVTGFAYGNDAVATKTAVERNTFSIALLGGGVDVIYPKSHEALYNKMLKCGLFLSEQPPGTVPYGNNFPKRNRILAGICKAVLVTEAPKRSGALITAHQASDEGRDVFVIPGSINAFTSVGANTLIQEGAKPVLECSDILCEYPELINAVPPLAEKEEPTDTAANDTQSVILAALGKSDMNMDELSATTGISMTECNSCCFMLELTGKIVKLPGNFYHKK